MRQNFRGCESRDDRRTLVAHALAADRANKASERVFRAAAQNEPALEAGALGRGADHPDIAGIVSPQRRIGEPIIECVTMRENDESGPRGRLRNFLFRIVEAFECDIRWQGRGRGLAVIEKRDRERQGSERTRQRKPYMPGAEKQHLGFGFGLFSSSRASASSIA